MNALEIKNLTVSLCNRCGGMIPSPDEVLEAIRSAVKGVNK